MLCRDADDLQLGQVQTWRRRHGQRCARCHASQTDRTPLPASHEGVPELVLFEDVPVGV